MNREALIASAADVLGVAREVAAQLLERYGPAMLEFLINLLRRKAVVFATLDGPSSADSCKLECLKAAECCSTDPIKAMDHLAEAAAHCLRSMATT